jgi:uncharacterized protein YndB with AHSA1/START domain
MTPDDPTRVTKSVTVRAPIASAFAVFTRGIDRWWPRSHKTAAVALEQVVLEPREGGRWYEVDADGSEPDWGCVVAWEPPARVVLTWQVDADGNFDPALFTYVEVRFTAEGPERTRVDLEHRGLDAYGPPGAGIRRSFDSPDGWRGLLDRFVAAAHDQEAAPRRGGLVDGVTE